MLEIKVLIVEDDDFLLNKLSKMLKREISEVYTFKNPTEALNNIKNINPDIIVSDIKMPEMSGLEMYKKIKDDNLNIPVILASAFSEPEYFIEAIKLKVKKFIVKPIDLDELMDELKEFEKEILKEKTKIKQEKILMMQSKMAAMGEMLANIAHQWKQPLNTISICSSNVALEYKLENIQCNDNTLKDMLDNITESILYMNETINDFQSYFKPNKLESCFFIKDTLMKVQKLLSSQIKTFNILIIDNIEDFNLCGYQNELIQVLINIQKNAIDELQKIEGKRIIKIDAKQGNEEFIISIHDNAGGIDEKFINKIFHQYFSTKDEKGTGIGLHMAKQIIECHHSGTIKVSNEVIEYEGKKYKGAKFTVKIKSLKNLV